MNPLQRWCHVNSDNICCNNITYIANLTCPTTETCDKIIVTPFLHKPVVLDAYQSDRAGDMYNSFLQNGTIIGLPNSTDVYIFVAKTGDSTMRYTLNNNLCFKV